MYFTGSEHLVDVLHALTTFDLERARLDKPPIPEAGAKAAIPRPHRPLADFALELVLEALPASLSDAEKRLREFLVYDYARVCVDVPRGEHVPLDMDRKLQEELDALHRCAFTHTELVPALRKAYPECFDAAVVQPVEQPPDADDGKPTITKAELRRMTGLANSRVTAYTKAAGVSVPGKGGAKRKYTRDEARRIVQKAHDGTTDTTVRAKCAESLKSLSNPRITIKSR